MDRFVPLSATTSSLGSHLGPDEEILTLQEHVGLYHGTAKAKRQADGTLYLSSHRIIYVDRFAPLYHSCALSLALVRQTEYYAGFLKSSPKITLKLEPPPQSVLAQQQTTPRRKKPSAAAADTADSASLASAATSAIPRSWICPVCGFSNTDTDKCSLCGVSFLHSKSNRQTSTSTAPGSTPMPSSSLPSSSSLSTLPVPPASGSASSAATTPRAKSQDPISCPTCTFLNHPSMSACELCSTPLPGGSTTGRSLNRHASSPALPDAKPSASSSKSVRARTTSTSAGASPRPDIDSDDDEDEIDGDDGRRFPISDPAVEHVKLSFRKGGDKAFYELLRTTLRQKAWQVSHAPPSDRTRTLSTNEQTASPARSVADVPRPSSSTGTISSVPSFATTIDIDGRRIPLSILHQSSASFAGMPSSKSSSSTPNTRSGSDAYNSPTTRSGAGIEAILRNTSLSHSQASSHMLDSLADLDALQKRAKGMVEMAEKLNAQLSRLEADEKARGKGSAGASSTDTVDRDSATLIRSSLVMLGLPSPAVTEDMVAERGLYELELARELAGLLLSSDSAPHASKRSGLMGHGRVLGKGKERSLDDVRGMEQMEDDLRLLSKSNAAALVELVEGKMQGVADDGEEMERILAEYTGEESGRGLIGLDEVWCIWNRARGVALVPPSDLRACAVHLPRLTEPPVRLRVFPAPSTSSNSNNNSNNKRVKSTNSSSSGLCVLHTPRYSESAFEARILARLRFTTRRHHRSHPHTYGSGSSAFELASRENAPVVLIEQMLSGIEMGDNGSVVRDEGVYTGAGKAGAGLGEKGRSGGPNTRWFENEFDRAWGSVRSYRTAAV
ncbi:hypothetical protein A4X09_0g3407 [Tilletia walkeri]|uniref:Vacuolar protein-sorting-associated protein 36 n=1 Tax=Tilletia walkeri TaxID=117179 RepID=A0A8X7T4Z0_9BASI|nr:hypothetical protein A4X09_0g3407 [Tilletia walkeri]